LGRNAFDLDRILDIEPEFLHAAMARSRHDHDHGDAITTTTTAGSSTITTRTCNRVAARRQAAHPDKFFPWVQDLVAKDGPSILRCKGILNFKDDPDRFVFRACT
jgi:G3E family GTPase